MLVQDVMTRKVISVRSSDTVAVAREVLRSNRIHHLLVIDAGPVVGTLSYRDLAGHGDNEVIRDVMSRDFREVESAAPLKAAAALMVGGSSGCLPVLAGGKLAGIITTTDLLRQLSARAS